MSSTIQKTTPRLIAITASDPPICPHCRYAADTAPAWQCPAGGIAYATHQSYLDRTKLAVAPRQAGDPISEWSMDASLGVLLAVNILTLAHAFHQRWSTMS